MDFSRLNNRRVVVGGIASILLIVSILFMSWYSYDLNGIDKSLDDPDAWICGTGETSCTGFETFPILRWLLLLAALAPLILGYIIVRGHKLSYPPGEITMLSGFAASVLIAYNGLIDKPGSGPAEIGLSLDVRVLDRARLRDRDRAGRLHPLDRERAAQDSKSPGHGLAPRLIP